MGTGHGHPLRGACRWLRLRGQRPGSLTNADVQTETALGCHHHVVERAESGRQCGRTQHDSHTCGSAVSSKTERAATRSRAQPRETRTCSHTTWTSSNLSRVVRAAPMAAFRGLMLRPAASRPHHQGSEPRIRTTNRVDNLQATTSNLKSSLHPV